VLDILLYSPEIPGNTGAIGRSCLALNARLVLIHPLGFDLSEKSVRRAGLDYWKHVQIKEFQSFDDYLVSEDKKAKDLFYFTKFAKKSYFKANFKSDSTLVFGRETKGLPVELMEQVPEANKLKLPMLSEHVRSLNLANAATAAMYEAYRQIRID